MLLVPYFTGGEGPTNFRHLMLFLGLLAVVPAVAGLKNLRAAHTLTPELLAKETAEKHLGFQIWTGLQTARLTIALVIAFSVVTIMQIVAFALGSSSESAALAKAPARSGEWWRLLTSVFLHAGLPHLLFNAIGLGVFGKLVELTLSRMLMPIVFLVSALSGSLFSLYLNPGTSVGASGGILGLAGFLFTSAAQRKAVPLPRIQQTVASVALITAIGGIVAFDLFDSAAHLGGLLAGLALGFLIKDPKKLSSNRAFKFAGILSCLLLLGGAVLAVVLMLL